MCLMFWVVGETHANLHISMSITQQPKVGLNDKFFIGLNFELGAGKGLTDLLGHISKLTGYFAPNISERRKIDCLRMSVRLSLKRIIENILAQDESYFLQEFGLPDGDLGDDVLPPIWQSPSSGVSNSIVPNSRSYAISYDVVCHELFRALGFRNVRTTLENMVKDMKLEDTSLIATHNIEFQLGIDRLRKFGGEAVRLDDSLRWYGSSLPTHVRRRLTRASILRAAMVNAVALVETSDTFGFPKVHDRATPTAAIASVGAQSFCRVVQRGEGGGVDRYYAFEKDGVDAVHLPCLAADDVHAMSNGEVLEHFRDGPLSKITIGDISGSEAFALRRLLLMQRDVFAKNDKVPGTVNKAGCTINTGDAVPVGYPLRPTLPNMRPIIDGKLDELLKYGVIEHSSSPWAAAILLVPKQERRKGEKERRRKGEKERRREGEKERREGEKERRRK